ncbi:MAG: hypothetical protein B1H03_00580 [Planctomycetales bacterium 4484_113]|nr:MAG: hypothetical protein B1H03_00580 [Planctomycetales bacterium 4484_113]
MSPMEVRSPVEVEKQRGSPLWQIASAALFLLAATGILYVHLFLVPVDLRLGQVVPYNIISPQDGVYTDTTELAKLTPSGTPTIIDPQEGDAAVAEMHRFFDSLRRAQIEAGNVGEVVQELASQYGVDEEAVSLLLTYGEQELKQVETFAAQVISTNMKAVIDAEKLAAYKETIHKGSTLTLPEQVGFAFLRVNLKPAARPQLVQEYIERLVSRPIKKGEIILGEGGVVDQVVLDKLAAVRDGFVRQKQYQFAGLLLLLAALMLIWFFHLFYFKPSIFYHPVLWGQITLIFLVAMVLALVLGRVPFRYVFYMVPLAIAAAVIIFVTVYDAILALYFGIGLTLILSLSLNFNSNLTAYMLLSAVYPVVFLSRKSEPRHLVSFGFNLGVFNVAMVLMVILVSVETFSWFALSYAFVAGVAAAIIALGVTPFLEMLSTQLTPGKLQLLLNPENPLLKRLLEEAPGTYFHSLIMANMAEEGCNEIGANGLLAKVGAMYHDIGKLKRPGFFAENIGDEAHNPHRNLPPESSYNIILQHVVEGVELGRKYGLPPEVLAFIPEHHGTGVMKYFFETAKKREGLEEGFEITEQDYRYPGPNPQSKETGVVMLADTCEAMIRARESFTEEEVRDTVRQVVRDKLEQGYLDSSGLTAGDLNRIVDSFTQVLVNLHHSRLKYPGDEKQAEGEVEVAQ